MPFASRNVDAQKEQLAKTFFKVQVALLVVLVLGLYLQYRGIIREYWNSIPLFLSALNFYLTYQYTGRQYNHGKYVTGRMAYWFTIAWVALCTIIGLKLLSDAF